ncbi:hypothetical protein GIB67_041385 [Kingdonia uniflora]|uniref:Endonuclease/exonuclease/phosphatase domain-containing protein n=1 Tax=Kingdonia uniflora TaxID=39325 RepID=A0A7J7LRL1_9MAGN|nr:hypothetical protein GIB67_041385 [Kingdonia uniflora]
MSQSHYCCCFSSTKFATMLGVFNKKLRRLCAKLRWSIKTRSRAKVVVKKFRKSTSKGVPGGEISNKEGLVHQNGHLGHLGVSKFERRIRIVTFNAAMFSMAPAVPKEDDDYMKAALTRSMEFDIRAKSINDRPKSILKQSPLHPKLTNNPENLTRQQQFVKSKLRVSINLPDNEISLERSRQLSFVEEDKEGSSNLRRSTSKFSNKGKGPLKSSLSLPTSNGVRRESESFRSNRSILEVLREVDADILALQDVKAEEEKGMTPLSDLANALGMKYVFAESWAPEYGNAVLSKWPIKRWKVQKIFDDTDFRNVLKATIEVPRAGEVNFYCTQLDHLDENWRMKQINAIIESNDGTHILAGGINSLEETDYSIERWTDIVKYYEEIGKPKPKVEVMNYLKEKQYVDAKDFTGECESVVMIAKGQNVQGTCKYGTRVDYILASPTSPYKFVPGSYSVLSSKGTSDHHIVKVDIVKVDTNVQENVPVRRRCHMKKKVIKITNPSSPKGIWRF